MIDASGGCVPLNIALAQINTTVGDLSGNVKRIIEYAREANRQHADLLITPQLALCGMFPEDLLLRKDFLVNCESALEALSAHSKKLNTAILVGHPAREGRHCFNAATLIQKGKRCVVAFKKQISRQSAFDEGRYFEPGKEQDTISVNDVKCHIVIGLDDFMLSTQPNVRDLDIVMDASPYHMGIPAQRFVCLQEMTRQSRLPVCYVNLVGGQDGFVFDGGACALDSQGKLCHQQSRFEEALSLLEYAKGVIGPSVVAQEKNLEAEVYQALIVGLRDYVEKNAFPGVILGLSGGMDSALTLAIAVDALGADRVRTVMMPSPYTAQISLDDAQEMADLTGVRYDVIPILPAMQTFSAILGQELANLQQGTAEENIQARIRGMILMALSNRHGSLVLTTSNKSETAVGFCTLYGDMAGGFAVIQDVVKTLVYRLARWRNTQSYVIPERIITRAPSAELKPGQTDQDNLPSYEVLDAIICAYMENGMNVNQIVAKGYPDSDVKKVVRLLKISEYKRRQAPLGTRVTQCAFGKSWRYPVTNHYQEA